MRIKEISLFIVIALICWILVIVSLWCAIAAFETLPTRSLVEFGLFFNRTWEQAVIILIGGLPFIVGSSIICYIDKAQEAKTKEPPNHH